MTADLTRMTGPDLAQTPAPFPLPEASRGLETGVFPGEGRCDVDPLNPSSQPSRLLDAWRPSDRRRLGLLSTRSYEKSAMTLPTDVWSYQRLFIDQQRDSANPFATKIGPR
jgi:hypothetical protein